jgi:anti-sigma B factor antagonist
VRRWTDEDIAVCEAFCAAHASVKVKLAAPSSPPILGLRVVGDLDTSSSTDFLKAATRLIPSAKASGGLVVELSGLRYISSTGVGALASLMTESGKQNLPFHLSGVQARSQSIFEALGLWAFFNILPPLVEEA